MRALSSTESPMIDKAMPSAAAAPPTPANAIERRTAGRSRASGPRLSRNAVIGAEPTPAVLAAKALAGVANGTETVVPSGSTLCAPSVITWAVHFEPSK